MGSCFIDLLKNQSFRSCVFREGAESLFTHENITSRRAVSNQRERNGEYECYIKKKRRFPLTLHTPKSSRFFIAFFGLTVIFLIFLYRY